MPINFYNFASSMATAYKVGKSVINWLTDAKLKDDFKKYLSELETRRVLYVKWEYENIHGVLKSLDEILDKTRTFRAQHASNQQVGQLLKSLIITIQKQSDTIRGCNMHSVQGEFMAYRALLKVRTEMAKTLAIFCGMLGVNPNSTDLEQFIMNMAVVKPNA